MGKRLEKTNLLVFVGSKIVSKSISFLLLPLYTSWLVIEEYVITIYANFLLGIASLCIAEFIFPKHKIQQPHKEYFSKGLF
jgi:hypothetical protein